LQETSLTFTNLTKPFLTVANGMIAIIRRHEWNEFLIVATFWRSGKSYERASRIGAGLERGRAAARCSSDPHSNSSAKERSARSSFRLEFSVI
jgi:hypothetical protein